MPELVVVIVTSSFSVELIYSRSVDSGQLKSAITWRGKSLQLGWEFQVSGSVIDFDR